MGTEYRLLVFLIQFSSIHFIVLISSAYVLPTEYFINCGSNQVVIDNRRNFTGDESRPVSFAFTKQNTSTVATPNQPLSGTSPIYNTARIFRQQSSYSFDTNATASTYLVRLHFSAFNSDLSGAVFDVTTSSAALLLHNFRANSTPSVEEFFVRVSASRFSIYFTPTASSLAFVNAVELFQSPPAVFNAGGGPVLQTVYRINVGGGKIDSVDDEIWRNWDTDGEFLRTTSNAVDTTGSPRGDADTLYLAPDSVYGSATSMNVNMNNSNLLTWSFGVNGSAGHLVRAHFCDIISQSLNTILFNLSINGNVSKRINDVTTDTVSVLAQPVYVDTVVGSLSSGVLNISVIPDPQSYQRNAFLNGLEILEIKQGTALVPVEKAASGGSGSKLPAVIGAVAGLCVLVAAVVVFFLVAARRRKAKKAAEHSSWGHVAAAAFGGSAHSRVTEGTTTINGSPVPNLHLGLKISFSEIQQGTKNFNAKMIVGRGGFGNVYKGTLLDGKRVAVKRSNPGSGQGLFEFHTEIMVLSSIRHRHLVSLIGYCDEKGEMILVYEFMENGTLRDHLYNSDRPKLTWKQRLEICIGSAGGLNYLHKGSAVRIIHRDVKSTNILLDENFVAKVADFGLSKAGPLEDTHVSTNVKGTLGYWDPEYFRSQQLTEKSDVYSFGVVLMEVLCARPAIDTALPREQVNLAEWSLRCKNLGVLGDIVDPSIRDQINPNSLRKFAESAEKCLQEDGSDRPAMSDVIWDLEYALQLQQTPAAREPHEDSTVATASGFSAAIVAPDFGRIPSLGGGGDDDSYLMSTDFTEMSASEVFSQLKRDGGR